jgi:hypothetical protein
MFDRVVLIHDTPDQTIISELDIEQAGMLLEQLQDCVSCVLDGLRQRAGKEFTSLAVPLS